MKFASFLPRLLAASLSKLEPTKIAQLFDELNPVIKMKYELRPDQSLGKNLFRIFRQQIDGGLALARGERKPADTLVHDMRKHLKKARAVLRLLRVQIGRDSFCREDRRLRDIGRLRTEVRDAEVRLQTMRQLEQATHHHYRSYQKIERLLAIELENFLAAFAGWEKKAVRLLERARRASKKWSRANYRWRRMRRALQQTYKSGRKALATARSEPSAENIHELRKQTKLLGYQIRLLRPWNNLVVGGVIEELTELGHLLGRVHDLVFLGDRLRLERSESHWGKQDDELLGLIENSEAELQRDGIEIAERFFAQRPSKFGVQLDEWFKDRQHTRTPSAAEALIAA
jgi:CHAD domain-containing protein